MSGDDLLRTAAEELYAAGVDAFTERRRELAARARAAGEPGAARQIAALRKPTRSAWAVNQLVRADPGVPGRLSALAGDLRAAEAALDGPRIRELSQARRELVDALVRQALGLTGEAAPSAALAEEVTAIFGSALADPKIMAQLATGTLVRAEQRSGFGSGIPALALVPGPVPRPARRVSPAPAASRSPAAGRVAGAASTGAASRAARAASPRAGAKAGGEAAAEARMRAKAAAAEARARARVEAAAAAAEAKKRAAEAAAAEAERERRRALAGAERAAADASRAVEAATVAVRDRQAAVRRMEEQLTEAREALAEARVDLRQAENTQRRTQQTLGRLRQ